MNKILMIVIGVVVLIGVVLGIMFFNNHPLEQVVSDKNSLANQESDPAFQEKDPVKLRQLYKQAEDKNDGSSNMQESKGQIEKLNMDILFSPQVDEYSTNYVVQPGDALSKIAKKFSTTVNLIKQANGLKSDVIRPGNKLKVTTCKFSIVVDKSQNQLFLKVGEDVIKTYIVSTGKDNSSPVGTFKIVNKLENPTWFKSGAIVPPNSPDNILGPRWLGFDLKGYGIHGTTQPEQLGKQVTLGCVRMRNDELVQLYDIVPVGTEVVIVD